jgi:hypothetical protein
MALGELIDFFIGVRLGRTCRSFSISQLTAIGIDHFPKQISDSIAVFANGFA